MRLHSLFVLPAFLLLFHPGQAQKTMDFHQVVDTMIFGTTSVGNTVTFGNLTIPAGRIWKIENASLSYYSGGKPADIMQDTQVYLDAHLISSVNGSNIVSETRILWLDAGTYSVQVYTTISATTTVAAISALEFVVTP